MAHRVTLHSRYFNNVDVVIFIGNVTVQQLLKRLRQVATEFLVLSAAPVRVFPPVRFPNGQGYSIEP